MIIEITCVEVRGRVDMSRSSVPAGARLSSKVLDSLAPSGLPTNEFVENGLVKGIMGMSGRRSVVGVLIGKVFVSFAQWDMFAADIVG